ncbi:MULTISPECIES: deoxyribose-phosphate aldolase [unclassified Candidatus Frackibacter]|uniref:deoxyribose-phosphate aldolase n=1 Tax=unclassified Candidatus Frackibacter TaxID=2648818 RepID=UPI00088E3638|nr:MULTISPECIES: deoxyribose-phosphate aldolase [unclassified Candidatus Frackibacter]SDC74202.1 deoxyribose-phosphate aldolase [Candidatus Frackibacter sp. WG11]SEM88211.1 deoxyribose-phosphate aldolase [Candidatus Frackibacter sp. WG12]SFL97621.1 deoxyribose-phosphate aldolase [Candidatus Frackibacter sp. WG13]
MAIKPKDMAKMIDHTILSANTTVEEVKKKCEEAKEYKFASVCVNPSFVPLVSELLKETSVKVCTVIGFPLGASTQEVKAFETKNAIRNGAQEIDMVANIGAIKSGAFDIVYEDIKAVVDATKIAGVTKDVLTKVIIETCYLTDEEKVKVCELAKEAKADFVKTSTGFGTDGATTEDVSLMRKTVGRSIGVKASGGIRNFDDALDMLDAGANRIGASSGIDIVDGKRREEDDSEEEGY